MSHDLLQYSMFEEVFFPRENSGDSSGAKELSLRRSVGFSPHTNLLMSKVPLVVFDLETTGLDSQIDKIVEIGAHKIHGDKFLGEFDYLVDPQSDFPLAAQKISGITPEMLVGKPTIEEVLPKFFEFIEGSILVAHNANFDMGFIRQSASRMGIDFNWPSFCTLKLAREMLPDLERKTLDSLANHYQLTFEARHRSIGDVKVTLAVMQEMLASEGQHLRSWKDFEPFSV